MRQGLRAAALGVALMATCAQVAAQADEVQVVRAWFDDARRIDAVAPLLGHAQIDRSKGLMRTEADMLLRARLIAAGFRVEVDAEATDALHRSAAAFAGAASGDRSISGFACYRTVEEAQARLDQLVADHPDLLSTVDIGPSWQWQQGAGGYRLRVARATNSAIPGPKPALFAIASIHAREYTPAELLLRFLEDLIESHGSDADATWILDHHEIHILVHANPDGRKRAEAGASWRKNTNTASCGTTSRQGIDLNRNFPFAWNSAAGGSSGNGCDETYRGPSAGSEPETQAIAAYAEALFGDHRGPLLTDPAPADTAGIFMDVHSFSELVLWPWGATSAFAPNSTALAVLGRRLAAFNGYTAQAAVGLYPTDGTTDDYTYGELGIASYAFELGTAFFQDCASFENRIEPDNRAALRYAARVLRAPYILPAGPDTTGVRIEPDLILAGDAATVFAQLDDARQQTGTPPYSGPVPAVQPIASAGAWLTPPWSPGAVAQPLVASDGVFDTPVEAAQGTLDTTTLAPGRHLVYVQARDSSGADGPVGAGFVEVVAPDEAAAIAGRITDIVSGAPLTAQIDIGAWRSTSAADGNYARVLRAGSWPLRVAASGYEAEVGTVHVAAGDALTRDVALYRTCALVEDPVETAVVSPFTQQTPWQKRAGAGRNGGAAWMQSAAGNYANNLNVSLTSAAIDLSGYGSTTLRFDQLCNTEAGWDYGIVETRIGTGSWSEVFRCDGETLWRTVELPLPQLDGQASAQVRFRFRSDQAETAPGWRIDNIVLSAGGAACRAGQVPQVQIGSFAATPTQIVQGDASTLAWTTQHASACSITSSLGGAAHTITAGALAAGSLEVTPSSDAVFTLSCDGAGGPVTAQAAIAVAPPPVVILDFDANPDSIGAGEDSTLSWSTTHATACSIGSSLGGAAHVIVPEDLASGTHVVTPAADAVYTLSCAGGDGPVSATANIAVTPPAVAILAFAATPAAIASGENSTLAWSTEHATACTIGSSLGDAAHVIAPEDLANGTLVVSPHADATYTLSCDGEDGPVTAQATIAVTSLPVAILGFEASPDAITRGDDSTLSWSTEHADACRIDSSLGGAAHTLAPEQLAGGTLVLAPDADVVYTLSCDGVGGPVSAEAAVEVAVPPRPPRIFEDGFEDATSP